MREGWKAASIEDVAQVVNGGTPKTKVSKYWDGGHLWITPAEMGRLDSPYIALSRRKLTDEGIQNSSATLVPRNSVILSTRAPIGHLVINNEPMAFNQGCRGLIPRQQIHYKYLYYFLLSSVDLLNELGSGTTFKELAAGKLKKVEIPLAPLPEQKRIVAILDEAFAGIATAVANTEKNLANARELFESYLSTIFCSEAELQTKGWELVKLIEICEKITDGVHKKPIYVAEGVPFIKINNLTAGPGISFDNVSYISEADHKEFTKRTNPERGDILITKDGTIGIIRVIETDVQFSIFVSVALIKPKDKGISPYLKYVLESPLIQNEIKPQGTALKHLYLKDLRKFDIPLAPEKEREKIVADLDALSDEIRFLESIYHRKYNALSELKQSLLQKAFSGELTTAPQDEIENALA